MRILFVGDIFGRPGRIALANHLTGLKSRYHVDFCIANGENAAGGKGITREVAQAIYAAGVDVITLGNHAWDNKDVFTFIDEDRRLVRAYNFPPDVPGRGFVSCRTATGQEITVAQLCGRVFMTPVDCPFRRAEDLLREIGKSTVCLIDIHGEASSEKSALGWFLDGRVTAVIGTHTHVPTADERILPGGTAYITDVGMTGPYDSIIGMDIDSVIKQFKTSIRVPFKVASQNVHIACVLITTDPESGRALSIERIFMKAHDFGEEE
ncbi:MAG TPA: TIGR00282 family metallophosphoesterase [bacterium]|nr:TIGR00282 family metallophosphoesterase [bacterium]